MLQAAYDSDARPGLAGVLVGNGGVRDSEDVSDLARRRACKKLLHTWREHASMIAADSV